MTTFAALYCATVLIATAAAQTTFGCIEAAKTQISGNYSKINECNQHSIWIKDSSIGESYVIYFTPKLTTILEGFAFYKCDSTNTYVSQMDPADCESPATIMGCEGKPSIYCPTLTDADISYMTDGLGADTNVEFIDMENFYNCTHWYVWDDASNYDSTTTMSFTTPNEYCASSTSSNSNHGTVKPGGTVKPDNDKNTIHGMSQSAILWTVISIFIIICVVVIAGIGYRWRQKKLKQETDLGGGLLFDS